MNDDLSKRVAALEGKFRSISESPVCPQCGGKDDGTVYTSMPPQLKCVDCSKFWTP